jgi:uncharacterized protein (TIGR01777 family)
VSFFQWDPDQLEIEPAAVEWAEAVVNLAGASIGETRWNETGKKRILESRLFTVRTLSKAFSGRNPLKAFVGISGAGFYGPGNHAFGEEEAAGVDFPARVAWDWEKEYQQFRQACKPEHFTVLRMAVVLSKKGGALEKIIQPFRFGAGAILGNGRQPFNWIHLEDTVQIIARALEWNGIFNASAPATDNNAELSRLVAGLLKRPIILPPVPAFLLRTFLGDRASLVLEGNFSNTDKLLQTGYKFRFPELQSALSDLLKK